MQVHNNSEYLFQDRSDFSLGYQLCRQRQVCYSAFLYMFVHGQILTTCQTGRNPRTHGSIQMFMHIPDAVMFQRFFPHCPSVNVIVTREKRKMMYYTPAPCDGLLDYHVFLIPYS